MRQNQREEVTDSMRIKVKRSIGLMLGCLLLCSGFTVRAAKVSMKELLEFRPTIDTSYNVELKEASNVYIRNDDTTDSGVIYMEYEVEEVETVTATKMGLYAMNVPLLYAEPVSSEVHSVTKTLNKSDGNLLLEPGAKYYICISTTSDDGWEYFVQQTHNGKSVNIIFPNATGEWQHSFRYFNLFFGGKTTCKLKNFKCYDANGKNLGIRLNTTNETKGKISTVGDLKDDAISEGFYYCKEKPELGFIVLGRNNKGYCEKDERIEEFSYDITGNGEHVATLFLKFDDGKVLYDYQYLQLTDEEGNLYKRLRNSKVTFVIGEETTVLNATQENGFRVTAPDVSDKDGHAFEGWFLGNNKEYDLESVVTESVTLYAKWEGLEIEFLDIQPMSGSNTWTIVFTIAGAVVIIGCCTVGSVLILRRKKRGGKYHGDEEHCKTEKETCE